MFVSSEEQKRRYDLCKQCEHLRKTTKTCKLCNCVMPLKTKLESVSCPVGKWGKSSWG